MGIPNKGEGGGARTTMQKCLWTYHRIVRFKKIYCRCLNFDSLALGFYPDAGFFSVNMTDILSSFSIQILVILHMVISFEFLNKYLIWFSDCSISIMSSCVLDLTSLLTLFVSFSGDTSKSWIISCMSDIYVTVKSWLIFEWNNQF